MKVAFLLLFPLLVSVPAFAYTTYEETIVAAKESQEVQDVLASIEEQYGVVCDENSLKPASGGSADDKVLVATCNVEAVPEGAMETDTLTFVYLQGRMNGHYVLTQVRVHQHDADGNWTEVQKIEMAPAN